MKSVAVVTATTGRATLQQAIKSVSFQSHPCTHYIVADGANRDLSAITIPQTCELITLPKPTGLGPIMNGAILAMAAYLCTEEYLCFLDDDNWFEPDHIESLVNVIEGKAYAYSLRNLVNPDGSFYAQDNGESTGHGGGEFVDANCFLFRRDLAVGIAPLWIQTNGEMNVSDRYVWKALQEHKTPWGASGKYSVNYRMSSRGQDMKPFFFIRNIMARAKHPDGYPWAA